MEFDTPDSMHRASPAQQVQPDLAHIDVTAASHELEVDTIDAILRTKRKRRSQRVCQPCRLRKVKCTYEVPCQSCAERGHPELCTYGPDLPPPKRVYTDKAGSKGLFADDGGEHWLPSKQEWDEMRDKLITVDQLLRELGDDVGQLLTDVRGQGKAASRSSPETSSAGGALDPVVVQGMPASNALTGDAVYLGGNSVPAMVVALADNNNDDVAVRELLGKSTLPVFGLDNESATYPFVDLWGIPHGSFQRIELLCKLLPSDSECMQIFRQYRDTAHVIFPGVVDALQFESDLLDFLRNRGNNDLIIQAGGLADQSVYGKNLHWLGLLFATFASGLQCSDLPRKERQMKSQVYGTGESNYSVAIVSSHSNFRNSCLCIRMPPHSQLPFPSYSARSPEFVGFRKCDIK